MKCIYCSEDKLPPFHRAHILPESLVGESDYVLENGEVCLGCNSATSVLEKHFIQDIDLLGLLVGPDLSKKGKLRRVEKPGFLGRRTEQGPHFFINSSDRRVSAPDGTQLKPAMDGQRYQITVEETPTGEARATVTREIRFSKPFLRALAKFAFETLCFHHGHAAALDSRLDPVRNYVLHGTGERSFVLVLGKKSEQLLDGPRIDIYALDGRGEYLSRISFFFIEVYVDLTSDCRLIARIQENASPEELQGLRILPSHATQPS